MPSQVPSRMVGVPRLSYFYGIAVYVYFEDHPPPLRGASQPGKAARCDRAAGVAEVAAMDITEVEVIEGHTVRLRFEDGIERTVDLDPYLHGPVFEEIRRDAAVFAAVRVDA